MTKTYIERVKDLGLSEALHYWSVEVTIEDFISTHLKLFDEQDKKTLSPIEEEFPYPYLGRTLRKYIPKQIKYDLKKRKLTMFYDSTFYPEGTTHLHVGDLYVDEKYFYYGELPTAIKIDKGVWHVYKTVGGVDKWVPIEDGTHIDVIAVEKLAEFDSNTELKMPAYVIDDVINLLSAGSLLRNLLVIYRYHLSDLFEQRLDFVKLIRYFACDRVFPIYLINEEDYNNTIREQTEQNERNEALNDTFSQLISSYDFQLAYNQAIGVCSVE